MAESNDKEIISQQPDNALTFRATMQNIFKNIAESVSEEEFMGCLTFFKSKQSLLRKLHRTMVDDLYESMNAELEEILAEGSLSEALGKLKELSTQSIHDPNHIAWRPPGNVLEHLRSHDAEKMIKEQEILQELVEDLEVKNDELKERILVKRAAAQKIDDRVNRALKSGSLAMPQMHKTSDRMQKYIETLFE
ncbi:hypothetical protein PV328_009766 [Microctonus aethiopoides]|uniref:Polyamine-modulated factor 1 n=1 Tax=Microctonus aethiopoides TaxID=144406 RepID=A0AA39C6I4_9HYME|nr:hypothetical protein PV328_009766 [Microctonus aethiopoides]